MMEKSLYYEINTYYQNGKPSAVKPVMIEYRTNSGKGTINLDMVRFFPCTVHDIKTVIDILWMAPDTYEKAEIIAEYLRNVIADLQNLRRDDAYSYEEKQYNTKLTGFIKKYLANLEKIAGAFGLETVKDEKAECAKMHKCEVHTIHFEDGKKVIKTFDGKYFVKNGVKYKVYKACKARYEIIVAGTGISIGYCNKLETAPEFIDEQKERAIANIKKDNGFEKVHADFVALCDAHGITAPELSPVLLNNQEPENTPAENTPAPALDAKSETSETRPAADQEPQTAEKPATPATAKKARKDGRNAKTDHNTIKRNTKYIIARALVDTNAGKAGEVVRIYFDNFTGWIIEHENGARFACFIQHIRNTAFYEILSQSETIPAGVEPFTMGNKEKSEEPQTETRADRPQIIRDGNRITTDKRTTNRPPYYIITRADRAQLLTGSPAQGPQVWKPCTMTAGAKNGIIYRDIMGAIDRQTAGNIKPFKAVLRLAKMQGYINLGATDKKPATGKIQAHKGKPAPGGYPPNKDGRNTAAAPQAHKMPQVTVRGSPKNQGEKNIENVFFQTENFSKIV